mgnify:CR=1 FL=1
MFLAMMIYGEPGCEILYPNPGFPIYESTIRFSGAKPIPIPLREQNGFAFSALPVVILFSAISAFLYYMGFLQIIVKSIAWVMSKTMKLSGAESLSAAGNIFLGQTEAPLLVKPYIKNMTKSDIMQLNVGDVALLKGEGWKGNEENGLIHRSPHLNTNYKRLYMTVDFVDFYYKLNINR